MKKDLIYFAHANGFPGACYRKFYSYLEDEYQINYLDTIGHNPAYPISDNWDFLTQEMIDNISAQPQQPVIGIGHSLGGILLYLASLQRPTLFKVVVMLDSPIFGTVKSFALKLIKRLGLIDKFTLGGKTKHRRRHWRNSQEALDYFLKKDLFKRFDRDCLTDYIRYGLVASAQGLTLKFQATKEYKIYVTIPDSLPKKYKNTSVPIVIIYGDESEVFRTPNLKIIQRSYPNILLQNTPGGHLFPFEYPEMTAKMVKNVLHKLIG